MFEIRTNFIENKPADMVVMPLKIIDVRILNTLSGKGEWTRLFTDKIASNTP